MSYFVHLLINIVQIYQIIIIIRCLLSFIQPDPYNPIVRFIYAITDPLLDAIRRSFPFLMQGGFDLSPIVAIFLIHFTVKILVNILV